MIDVNIWMSIHVVYAYIHPMLKLITCVIFFAVNEMKPYILSQFDVPVVD